MLNAYCQKGFDMTYTGYWIDCTEEGPRFSGTGHSRQRLAGTEAWVRSDVTTASDMWTLALFRPGVGYGLPMDRLPGNVATHVGDDDQRLVAARAVSNTLNNWTWAWARTDTLPPERGRQGPRSPFAPDDDALVAASEDDGRIEVFTVSESGPVTVTGEDSPQVQGAFLIRNRDMTSEQSRALGSSADFVVFPGVRNASGGALMLYLDQDRAEEENLGWRVERSGYVPPLSIFVGKRGWWGHGATVDELAEQWGTKDDEEQADLERKYGPVEDEPGEVERLRAELEAERASHRADVERIGRWLDEEARARKWCGEYESVVDVVNRDLTVKLEPRQEPQEFTVQVVTNILLRGVKANDQAAAVAKVEADHSLIDEYRVGPGEITSVAGINLDEVYVPPF